MSFLVTIVEHSAGLFLERSQSRPQVAAGIEICAISMVFEANGDILETRGSTRLEGRCHDRIRARTEPDFQLPNFDGVDFPLRSAHQITDPNWSTATFLSGTKTFHDILAVF